jgi:hypothetical protein
MKLIKKIQQFIKSIKTTFYKFVAFKIIWLIVYRIGCDSVTL